MHRCNLLPDLVECKDSNIINMFGRAGIESAVSGLSYASITEAELVIYYFNSMTLLCVLNE